MPETDFTAKLRALIASARDKAKDGLTLAEAGQLFIAFATIAIETASGFRDLPGSAKKAMVMAAIGELFDAIAPFIPLPIFLSPFRGIITPRVRTIVMAVASGAVEAIYARLKRQAPDHLEQGGA